MRGSILFVWRRLTPPFFIGGAEISQNILAECLVEAGYEVCYIGSHENPRPPGQTSQNEIRTRLRELGVTFTERGTALEYTWKGIRCWAASQREIEAIASQVAGSFRPATVISAQEGSAGLLESIGRGRLSVGWLHSVSKVGLEVLEARPNFALATSSFVANRAEYPTAQTLVFYPPFRLPAYRDYQGGMNLLMINPIEQKGATLVYQIAAALPDIRVVLVEGWYPSREVPDLPNISYIGKQWSMDAIYADARLLLVPSLVEEGFGRVAVEAGLCGVPSICSNRGGLPEAVGHNAAVLDPVLFEPWRDCVSQLFEDGEAWASYSQIATINANRYLRDVVEELRAARVVS